MGSLDPNFHQDAALDQIVCYTEVFTDLAMANQASASGKWVAEWLPRHYAHEETTVLEMIAKMSPELASFAREMKRQHNELRIRLESFRDHIAHMGEQRDLETAVAELKREGKDMSAEERKFAGLEN